MFANMNLGIATANALKKSNLTCIDVDITLDAAEKARVAYNEFISSMAAKQIGQLK
jgi:hypothetical protein